MGHRPVVRVTPRMRPRGSWWYVGCSCSWSLGHPHKGSRASANALYRSSHGAEQETLAHVALMKPAGVRGHLLRGRR